LSNFQEQALLSCSGIDALGMEPYFGIQQMRNKIENIWLFYTIFQEQALLSCSGKDALGMRNPTNEK
jgi:hypothetical protein